MSAAVDGWIPTHPYRVLHAAVAVHPLRLQHPRGIHQACGDDHIHAGHDQGRGGGYWVWIVKVEELMGLVVKKDLGTTEGLIG